MNNLKFFSSVLVVVIAVLTFLSCAENQRLKPAPDFNAPIKAVFANSEGDTIDFTNFESELVAFWEKGLEEYSIEIFCSCDCDGVFAAQDMINNHRNLLPSILGDQCQLDLPCDSLKQFMSMDCNFQNEDEYSQFIESTLQPGDYITTEEITLVLNILEDIKNNAIDIPKYRQSWHELSSSSNVNNFYSAMIIEIANSGDIFIDTFNPPGNDDPQPLWNKVAGAAIGATLSFTVALCYHGSLSGSEITDTLAVGAIAGAIRSL